MVWTLKEKTVDRQKLLGGLIVLVALIGVVVWKFIPSDSTTIQSVTQSVGFKKTPEAITIKGFIGGEKAGLFDSQRFKDIASDRYGLTVQWRKAGGIEMVSQDPGDQDFLFPSAPFPVQLFKANFPSRVIKEETAFNSPIVLFTWTPIADSLIRSGYAKEIGGVIYMTNMKGLIDAVVTHKKWADIGVQGLFGSVTVYTTSPIKSSSGNLFAGLVATIAADGDLASEAGMKSALVAVKNFYSRMGYMEDSSKDLFSQYLRMGMGAKPIIAGYEAQLVEFRRENPDVWQAVKGKIKIIYPTPTVWSSHTVIATSKNGTRLISALMDKDVQSLAWVDHGFRTGVSGAIGDTKSIGLEGIPATIDNVVPPPAASQMQQIMDTIAPDQSAN